MSLIRATATIGGFTMVSRLLGFVRDQLIAWALGTSVVSDAYWVALRLPNMFRVLFAEGAFSTAFVPVFARRLEADGKAGARYYAEEALSLLLCGALATLLLAELFTPWAVRVIAPGFAGDPGQFDLAVTLTRITFPYLVFITLASLQGGILNSLGRFAAAAVTPVLLNLFQIGAVIWSWRYGNAGGDEATERYAAAVLSWCVTAGGVTQFLWLMVSCARAGMALRLRWPHLTAEMRRLGGLMLWGVIGAGATQINLVISTAIASTLPAGSVSYLQYGDRVNQLPLAVIGIAVGTAILPTLSRRLQAGDEAGAVATQNRGLELALLLTLPAAAALSVIAEPIFAVLFQRGHFDALSAQGSAGALAAYAWGLPAFVLIKVLVPGLLCAPRHAYAGQDFGIGRRGQHRADADPVRAVPACRQCHGDHAGRLGQRAGAGLAAGTQRPFHARCPVAPPRAAHFRRLEHDGAGACLRDAAAAGAAAWRIRPAAGGRLVRADRPRTCELCRLRAALRRGQPG